MGYMRHDAIVVTAWDEARLIEAYDKAKELGLKVSEIVHSNINAYVSFLIVPDGSKEGWIESNEADDKRGLWKCWMKFQKDLYIDWVHISYGGSQPEDSNITEHSGQ